MDNDAISMLNMNNINDKVYFGLWCWFVFIITWSVINIVYWMVIHCSSRLFNDKVYFGLWCWFVF
jgi:hypothetical protein